MFAYGKQEYQSRFKERAGQYNGIYSNKDYKAKIDKEVAADMVGDYLFTNFDFVKHLSTANRNVFQWVRDQVNYLCKIVTAGSKEARELERVKRVFEKVWRESGKVQGETRYSVSYTTDNVPVAVIESDIFEGRFEELSESERVKIAKEAIKGFRPGVPVSGRLIGVSRKSAEHFTNSDYTDKLRNNDQQLYEDKLNIAQNIDDVIYASTDYINEGLKHPRKDNITQFARGKVLLDIGGSKYEASVLVGYTAMHDMVLYDVQDLKPTDFSVKEKKAQPKLAGNESYTRKTVVPSENSVPQVSSDVKLSISDSDGRQLTPEQSEFFKDSKMRDADGNLIVMYHGSQDAGFHTFDASKSDDDISLFFVDRNEVAASYSGTTETYEAKTIRTAEDMNNFLAEIGYDDYKAVEKNGKFELLENNENVAWSDTAQGLYEEFCWYEGVGEGDANYKVYLNLTNPLEVDAQGRNWNNVSREYSQEAADRYHSLTAEEKAALHDIAGWGEVSIFRDEIHSAIDKINEEFMSASQKSAKTIHHVVFSIGNYAVYYHSRTEDVSCWQTPLSHCRPRYRQRLPYPEPAYRSRQDIPKWMHRAAYNSE